MWPAAGPEARRAGARDPVSDPTVQLPSFSDLPEPIREDLWSVERLEHHAEALAASHHTRRRRWGDRRLRPRVWDNGKVLLASYRAIAGAIRDERAITPAAEWLVDNFHLVEEQLREIREDLPAGFYRQLPRLADEPWRGYPRVYALIYDFVAHTDSRFDPDALRRFVAAYQRAQPLAVGELWAVTISLRIVLVENLRRLAEQMVRSRVARERAESLADTLLGGAAEQAGAALQRHEQGPLDIAFAVVLIGRLRDEDPAVTPALAWLDRRLDEQGTTADAIVELEHQRQVAMNSTVRNIITSMRSISAFDWAGFFESVSLVDAALGEYAGYRAMEFATRDRYRHAVEELARGAPASEADVARRAVRCAAAAAAQGASGDAGGAVTARSVVAGAPAAGGPAPAEQAAAAGALAAALATDRRADPGYYLVGGGRAAFERQVRYRLPPWLGARRAFLAHPTAGYLGSLAVVTAAALAAPVWAAQDRGVGWPLLAALAVLALVPASDLAVQLLNAWVMERLGARALPRLTLGPNLPPELRTLVCIPALLTDPGEIEELIGRLEVHFLANPEPELRFALLTDWLDAPSETMPGDAPLLAAARAGIARLNARHGAARQQAPADGANGGATRFFLLHRRRQWSRGENCWLGWERKRGKLEELNRLLRGAGDTTFLDAVADARELGAVRYVLTLDADTRLPRGAACRLVGTMAHPLNRARFDERLRRVVEGYGILQPRVTPTLPSGREGSLYQRITSGPAGIDPYAAAVSDVYQDVFGEGSFTGKGIYDVDAFTAALAGRVPEGTLLSHDLLEGIFARSGLATDIELFEEFPAHFLAAQARQHRWARGDWQLLPWIVGGGRRRGPIPLIGRFKMFDNLRRTLVAPATWLLLAAAWAVPGAAPGVWTGFWLLTIALPGFLPVLYAAVPRRRGISKRSHVRAVGRDLALAAARVGLALATLAWQAWLMTDAMVRTLVRLAATRRKLLEWVTAAQARSGLSLDLGAFYRRMAGGVALAAAAAAAAALGTVARVGAPAAAGGRRRERRCRRPAPCGCGRRRSWCCGRWRRRWRAG